MGTVVVAGALASKFHNGGEAWVRMSWVRAFQQIGCDAYFVEQVPQAALTDVLGEPCSLSDSVQLGYFSDVVSQFGLKDRSCLLDGAGGWWGIAPANLAEVADSAEMLLNISGNLALPALLSRFRRRVYLDIDPAFTQYWHAEGLLGTVLHDHNFHYTIGQNIGRPECPIPTGDITWRTTRQPVVLADWPASPSIACERLTTVGSLRGPYGQVEHPDGRFGLKIHEMRRVAGLAEMVEPEMELAFSIDAADEADRSLLTDSGWSLVDPESVACGPAQFRDYVQGSDGEFSVAQGIYVETGSGWFSDRTVRYLASAKPVIVQDTGLAPHLPIGEGLITFRTLPEAAAAVRAVASDYVRHSRAARRIAEDWFEAGSVAAAMAGELAVAP